MNPEILSPITEVETIAEGKRIHIRKYLERRYGGKNWKKKKGTAVIKDPHTGLPRRAEVHWFESHGVGKVEIKKKRWLE